MKMRPFKDVRPELRRGDQVWLYRDEDTNLVSRGMPYAHVLVWLGDGNVVGEGNVVHVTKNKGVWQAGFHNLKMCLQEGFGQNVPAFGQQSNFGICIQMCLANKTFTRRVWTCGLVDCGLWIAQIVSTVCWRGIMTGTFEKISIKDIIKNEKYKENQLG